MTKEKMVSNLITYIEREYLCKFTTWAPYIKDLERERENLRSKINALVRGVSINEMTKFKRFGVKK